MHASYIVNRAHKTIPGEKIVDFKHMAGSNGVQNASIWSSPEGGCAIDIEKHIFCNRSLNMKNIVAVGFDMDYTFAQYKPETFESLAYNGTVRKLVHDLGYPEEVYFSLHLQMICVNFLHHSHA